jgi:hypothetical protein
MTLDCFPRDPIQSRQSPQFLEVRVPILVSPTYFVYYYKSMMHTGREIAHLYFHSPCFDGAVSAALTSEYLTTKLGFRSVWLEGVNYHLRDQWLATELHKPCAVVDFLYHPSADFWADHHGTSFLSEESRADFDQRKGSKIIYDKNASSCAVLLWARLQPALESDTDRYEQLVKWADKIDSARYESVEEAIESNSPALMINVALGSTPGEGFSQNLVRMLKTHTLEELAALPDVRLQFEKTQSLSKRGLERLKKSIHLTDNGVAVFDADATDAIINRYAPFYFFPKARYSAGIVRTEGKAKITTMRNPWLDFPSAPLGEFSSRLGGGGHQRVGSIVLPSEAANKASDLLQNLLKKLSEWESQG